TLHCERRRLIWKAGILFTIMSGSLPLPTAADWGLISAASARYPQLRLPDLTPGCLAEITHKDGLDVATAFVFARVWDSPQHRGFVTEVVAHLRERRPLIRASDAAFLLVPNLGYEFDSKSQETARGMLNAAQQCGFTPELIRTSSVGSLDENAERI